MEDDFILADLNIIRDDEELSPVPLDHFPEDEDAIDRLLIDADFDSENNKLDQAEWTFPAEDNQTPTSDFDYADGFDEISDDDAIDRLLINTGFDTNDDQEQARMQVVDDLNGEGEDDLAVELVEKNQQAESNETSTTDFYNVSALDHKADDEDAIDRSLINTGFDADDERAPTDALMVNDINQADQSRENMDEPSSMTSDNAIVYPEISNAAEIVDVQEENQKIARQNPDMIANIKPEQDSANKNAVEITTLNQIALEQENIQKQLNDYDHKIKKSSVITYVSLGIGIVALISAIAMGVLISGMKAEISKLTELVSILEEDMVSITEKNSEMKFNNNDSSIEQLNQKVNSLTKQLQAQSISDTSKNKQAATVIKQTAINKSFGDRQTRIYKLENKKSSKAKEKSVFPKKQVQVKKPKYSPPAEDWSVNLIAYKEKSYAKSKAAKFVKKGVPVKVLAVDVKNATLYRLKVSGFKNKLDATSYASKIKKSLNLGSVSVDKNS